MLKHEFFKMYRTKLHDDKQNCTRVSTKDPPDSKRDLEEGTEAAHKDRGAE